MSDALSLFNTLGQIDTLAQQHGVRPELIRAMAKQESGFNPAAVSPKGAVGLMQLMPGTAKELGVDPSDPTQNLEGGIRYFKQMLDRYNGDERLALAAYNAGPGRVTDHVPDIPETQQYVEKILGKGQSPDPLALFNSLGQKTHPVPHTATAEEFMPKQTVGAAAESFWKTVNPIEGLKGLANAAMHPIETGKALLEAQGSELQKAKENWDQGRYSEAIGHGAAGLLPVVGPAAAHAGERIGQGDIAGGVGEGLGTIVNAIGPKEIPQVAKGVIQGTTDAAAEGIINQNVKLLRSVQKRNPNVNTARTILDENLAPRYSGVAKAERNIKESVGRADELASEYTASGKAPLPFDQAVQNLDDLAAQYAKRRTPAEAAAHDAVLKAKQQLYDSSYGRDVYQQIQQGPGQPPLRVNVGRELVPQSAEEMQGFKRDVMSANKMAYGIRDSTPIARQADKALASGLRQTLEDAIGPELKAVNERAANNIVTKRALVDMIERNKKNFSFGLLDMLGLGSGKSPLAATLLLKHPTTAFPIAKMINAGGRAAAPIAGYGAAAGEIGNTIQNGQTRRITKAEAEEKFKAAYPELF